jgi:hypothetical protein
VGSSAVSSSKCRRNLLCQPRQQPLGTIPARGDSDLHGGDCVGVALSGAEAECASRLARAPSLCHGGVSASRPGRGCARPSRSGRGAAILANRPARTSARPCPATARQRKPAVAVGIAECRPGRLGKEHLKAAKCDGRLVGSRGGEGCAIQEEEQKERKTTNSCSLRVQAAATIKTARKAESASGGRAALQTTRWCLNMP